MNLDGRYVFLSDPASSFACELCRHQHSMTARSITNVAVRLPGKRTGTTLTAIRIFSVQPGGRTTARDSAAFNR